MHRSEAKGNPELDLERLRRELDEFAQMLGLTVGGATRARPAEAQTSTGLEPGRSERPSANRDADRLTTVLAWIKGRSNRNRIFGDDLFGEPAWDMLLDLYANHGLHRAVTISDLCVASRAPMSTALRWLGLLERKGLVRRNADPLDRRRAFVTLTDQGLTSMEQTMDSTTESNGKLGLGHLRLVE